MPCNSRVVFKEECLASACISTRGLSRSRIGDGWQKCARSCKAQYWCIIIINIICWRRGVNWLRRAFQFDSWRGYAFHLLDVATSNWQLVWSSTCFLLCQNNEWRSFRCSLGAPGPGNNSLSQGYSNIQQLCGFPVIFSLLFFTVVKASKVQLRELKHVEAMLPLMSL